MNNHYHWDLIEYSSHKNQIREMCDQLNLIDHYPAGNQWQYLFPLIDLFFDKDKVVFSILHKDNNPIFLMPVSIHRLNKFIVSWDEIAFPFHKHLNLIELPQAVLENPEIIDDLTSKLSKRFKHWSRFAIRNIQYDKKEFEEAHDVAWFNTQSPATIDDIVSKKHVKNIRRLEKRLLTKDLQLSLYYNHPSIKEALDDFGNLEIDSWKGSKGVAILCNPVISEMYEQFSSNFGPEKMIVAKLLLGTETIAATLGFVMGKTFYIHKISYKESYSGFAPGNILILKILELSLKDKEIDTVNLVTHPPWSERWHPNTSPIVNIVRYNNNFSGQVLKTTIGTWRSMKPYIKNIISKIKSKTTA